MADRAASPKQVDGSKGAQPKVAETNIETIVRLEQAFLRRRTFAERIGDAIASAVGSMKFAIGQLLACAAWVILNTPALSPIKPFDPYPHVLLALVVSLEGVMITVFILMQQNVQSARAEQRAHLNLQIDLLAEREISKMIELQRTLSRHLGIEEALRDSDAREFSRETAIDWLADQLGRRLADSEEKDR